MDVIVISDTIQEFNGERYYLCGKYFQKKGKRLHRVVWEYHNGPIPKGSHVHHKDEDRHNNQPSNLELLLSGKHLELHANSPEHLEYAKNHMLNVMIPKAVEWHKSEEGLAWHKEHGKQSFDKIAKEREHVCTQCGTKFKNKTIQSETKFCSNKCKSKYRRDNKLDHIEKICPVCGETFSTSKYKGTLTCSRKCGSISSAAKRKGVPQPKRK